jgi:undecaprenyl diphosphate synthase
MEKIPNHLGIILDGNRRWAKEKGLPSFEGHKAGLEAAKRIINYCSKKGIKTLTLFLFSTENWKRDKTEINFLMSLLEKHLKKDFDLYIKEGLKVKIIGQKEKLPKSVQKELDRVENATKDNSGMVLNLALSYGGRAEIVEAVKNIIKKNIKPEELTEDIIKENLWTSDVDLIIRTGKEKRISNFLIWQAAYSELYFSDKYWPDFKEEDLDNAIEEYTKRKRRFGK